MNSLTLPAFRPDGTALRLSEILSAIPENPLIWSIMEFKGIGTAPDGHSMREFEENVRRQPRGLIISWDDLKHLASCVEQTWDCTIIGARTQEDFDLYDRAPNAENVGEVTINAFDSTEWTIWASNSDFIRRLKQSLLPAP